MEVDRHLWPKGIVNVHDETECAGHFCCLHSPSDHPMRGWPMLLRETGLIERTCVHGVGHPDPDSAAWMDVAMGQRTGTYLIHGCEGCCSRTNVTGSTHPAGVTERPHPAKAA